MSEFQGVCGFGKEQIDVAGETRRTVPAALREGPYHPQETGNFPVHLLPRQNAALLVPISFALLWSGRYAVGWVQRRSESQRHHTYCRRTDRVKHQDISHLGSPCEWYIPTG